MFSIPRLSLVSRHITTPTFRHVSKMSGDLFKKTLRTAACIIIGDEILSGKVRTPLSTSLLRVILNLTSATDSRHQLLLLRQILFRPRNRPKTYRSYRRRRKRDHRSRPSSKRQTRFRDHLRWYRTCLFPSALSLQSLMIQ